MFFLVISRISKIILTSFEFLFNIESCTELHHKIYFAKSNSISPLNNAFRVQKKNFMSIDVDFSYRKSKKEHAENKHSNHHKQSLTHFHES